MSEYVTVLVDGLPDIFPGGEEIVRCRDCKHFCHDEFDDWCMLHDFVDTRGMADMFCAWGERRDG